MLHTTCDCCSASHGKLGWRHVPLVVLHPGQAKDLACARTPPHSYTKTPAPISLLHVQDFIRDKPITMHAMVGLYPANAVGDDIEIYTDDERTEVRATLYGLRQQAEKDDGKVSPCVLESFYSGAGLGILSLDFATLLLRAASSLLAMLFACTGAEVLS